VLTREFFWWPLASKP